MRQATLILMLAGGLTIGADAWADNFRCPNGEFVTTGDQLGEVAVRCDKPTTTTRREEPQETFRGKVEYIPVEEWTYNMGPSDFIYTLIFRNGKLAEIRSGGRGN
jgi:Protein of unknown function (DUF2845)